MFGTIISSVFTCHVYSDHCFFFKNTKYKSRDRKVASRFHYSYFFAWQKKSVHKHHRVVMTCNRSRSGHLICWPVLYAVQWKTFFFYLSIKNCSIVSMQMLASDCTDTLTANHSNDNVDRTEYLHWTFISVFSQGLSHPKVVITFNTNI